MKTARAGLALAVLVAGCGEPEPVTEERPQYTRPSFATSGSSEAETSTRFTDITGSAGVDFVHATGAFGEKWMPETMGSGVAVFDYDADGWPDIYLVSSTGWEGRPEDRGATSRLYRNRGDGTFEDVTRQAGLDTPIYGMGAVAADYDGDGDADLYVTAVGDNRLYRNDGGRYTDVTARAGAAGNPPGATAPAWSTAAAWLDSDGDRRLDLFVCNYVRWTPETDLFTTYDGENKGYATPLDYEGESCRLLRNDGSGGFDDVTADAGVENPEGKSLGVAIDDFNGDGLPDIAIANDTYQNFLYLNEGDGSFRDAALEAGVAFDEFGRARAGMGIDVADVTNRGNLSIGIGNFSNEPVALYTQIGESLFQDLAGAARITRVTMLPLTFGLRFADLDLDGYTDLMLGNGHIEPDIQRVEADVSFEQSPILLQNDGRGQFADVTDLVGGGFEQPLVARGIATADLDRDGDLDVVISTNGGPAKVLRNDLDQAEAAWVRVRLEGEAPNRDAIGATVYVYSGDTRQRFVISTSSSYLSQSETNPVVAGLGAVAGADSVVVVWPGGARSRRADVAAGDEVVISELDAAR
ncbi:MAG: CRTAC1 family protein [Gemmatimonadota bacterium]|nr:CRTAC1 family protein [Gemmatimonadota bacterium]